MLISSGLYSFWFTHEQYLELLFGSGKQYFMHSFETKCRLNASCVVNAPVLSIIKHYRFQKGIINFFRSVCRNNEVVPLIIKALFSGSAVTEP
jgi:hypothetical protein